MKKRSSMDPLQSIVKNIEQYCLIEKIDHRFVGGVAYGGLLNQQTSYKIDLTNREIKLVDHNPLSYIRDDKTLRDIDFIFLTTDPQKKLGLRRFIAKLKWDLRSELGQAPAISFEGLLPASKGVPRGFLRFVTVIEIEKNTLFLRFDRIRQKISRTSLEAWTVVLEDGMRYTTRNPIADYFAYQFRSPSGVKPKDIEKVSYLKKLVRAMIEEGKKYDVDYLSTEYYKPWMTYTKKLSNNNSASVVSKKFITNWYWSTIGTDLAHGKGLIRRSILAFFNLVTRSRQ